MNVIDTLITILRLDNRQFEQASKDSRASLKNTRDESDKTAKTIDFGGRKAADSIVKLKNEVMGLFTTFLVGTGVAKFVQGQMDGGAATGRLAKNLDMATESLSLYEGVVERAGGTTDDAVSSIQALVDLYQQVLNTGTAGEKTGFLKRLGINSPDELKDTDRALHIIARTMQGMDAAQAQFLGRNIGLSQPMINVLRRGPAALDAELRKQRGIGFLTERDTQADQAMQERWRALLQAATQLGRTLLTQATPYLIAFTDALNELAAWAETHGEAVRAVVVGIAAAMAVWAAVVYPIPVAIIALVSAIAALWHDFQQWKSGAKSFIDWSEWSDDIDQVMAAIKPLIDAIKNLMVALKPVGDWLAKTFGPIVKALVHGALHELVDQLHILADIINILADLLQGKWADAWMNFQKLAKDGAQSLADSPLVTMFTSGPQAYGEGPSRAAHDALVKGAKAGGGGSISDQVRARLTAAGIRSDLVEGITAGVGADSGFTTGFASNGAFGIGQWRGDRLKRLFARFGRAPNIAQQLQFLIWELRGGDVGGASVLGSMSADDALVNYVRQFMRPDRPGHPGEGSIGDINRGRAILRQLQNMRAHGEIAKASASGAGSVVAQSEVNVGQVNIQTQATDSKGIAKTIRPAIHDSLLVSQANAGIA